MADRLETRSFWRQQLLNRRRAMNAEERACRDRSIAGFLTPLIRSIAPDGLVALYLPIAGEPDVLKALCDEIRWVLPRVIAPGQALEFAPVGQSFLPPRERPPTDLSRSDGLVRGAHGINEPTASALLPDLIVTPCVGFGTTTDGRLWRLGYGGGYYDRTLAALGCPALGVADHWASISGFEPSTWDRPLTALITDLGQFGVLPGTENIDGRRGQLA